MKLGLFSNCYFCWILFACSCQGGKRQAQAGVRTPRPEIALAHQAMYELSSSLQKTKIKKERKDREILKICNDLIRWLEREKEALETDRQRERDRRRSLKLSSQKERFFYVSPLLSLGI